eukprot:5244660-Prymnesium_polylepis.2
MASSAARVDGAHVHRALVLLRAGQSLCLQTVALSLDLWSATGVAEGARAHRGAHRVRHWCRLTTTQHRASARIRPRGLTRMASCVTS